MEITREKERELVQKCYSELSKIFDEIVADTDNPLPSRTSVPYHQDGLWVRLSLDIKPVRKESTGETHV